MRYFVAGNIWLFFTLLLAIGCHIERTAPTRYSFFGLGNWFTPFTYGVIMLFTLGVAVALLLKSRCAKKD